MARLDMKKDAPKLNQVQLDYMKLIEKEVRCLRLVQIENLMNINVYILQWKDYIMLY